MEVHSKTFFAWLVLVIGLVLLFNYYDTVVLKHFTIFTSEEAVPEYTGVVNSFLDIFYSYVR